MRLEQISFSNGYITGCRIRLHRVRHPEMSQVIPITNSASSEFEYDEKSFLVGLSIGLATKGMHPFIMTEWAAFVDDMEFIRPDNINAQFMDDMEVAVVNPSYQSVTAVFADDMEVVVVNPSYQSVTAMFADDMEVSIANPSYQSIIATFMDDMEIIVF